MPQANVCATKEERLEWMRLCAERDRVEKFKSIATSQTKMFYKILEVYAEMLERRKDPSFGGKAVSNDKSASHLSSNEAGGKVAVVDFQTKAEQLIVDNKLNISLDFITEFMRQVIENGCAFNANHLFICMLHLEPDEVNETLADYLRVAMKVVDVKEADFVQFVDGITDKGLQKVFKVITHNLY